MSAPHDDEQALERLLRDLYDTTYDAETLPTSASVWQGVLGRLSLAQPAEDAPTGMSPAIPILSNRLLAPDDAADEGEYVSVVDDTLPATANAENHASPSRSALISAPASTPTPTRRHRNWRHWTLPRVTPPLIAAVLIASLFVGVFVALGFRPGASPQTGATHPCLQPSPTTAPSGVMALALNTGDTVLLRASDGQQLWRVHTGFPTQTPVVVGGVVYVESRANDISALRLADGSQVWNTVTSPPSDFEVGAPSVMVDCGVVLVNTANNGVEALRASDGARLWSYQDIPAPVIKQGFVYPYMQTTTLLAASDGIVYVMSQRISGGALDETLVWSIKALRETDGRLLWRAQPAQPDSYYLRATTRPDLIAANLPPFSGAVLGHTLYLIQVSAHPTVMAYSEQSGVLLWQIPFLSAIGNDAAIFATGPYLYLEQNTRVCRVSPTDGALGQCYPTALIGQPYLTVTSDALYVPVAGQVEPTVTINAIRERDGQRLWTWDIPRIGSFFPDLVFRGSIETAGVVGVVTTVAIYGLRASDGYRLWSWSPPGAFTHPDTDSYTITGATAG